MNAQHLVTVIGAAVTTFLLAGAVTIEGVTAAVGGEIGPGILGVFVGIIAGMAVAAAVQWRWPMLSEAGRTGLLAYAIIGLTVLGIAALSYVNVPGIDQYLGVQRSIVVGVVLAAVAAAVRWQQTRSPRSG